MKHIAALITAGVLIGAALIAAAFADGDKNSENANPNDGMPLLTVESFKEYYEGVVSAEGEITYNYDSLGRCISVVSADGTVLISYENNTVIKSSGNEESVYEYDEKGNLLSMRVYSGGILKSESLYTYDEEGRKLSYSYNFAPVSAETVSEAPVAAPPTVVGSEEQPVVQSEPGRPVGGIISPQPVDITALNSGTTEYGYSDDGLLIKEVSINGRGEVTRVSEYSYNEDGVLLYTTVSSDSGKVICVYRYEYDAEGRLVSELQCDAEGTVTCTTAYEYTAEGRLAVKAVVTSLGTEISREEHTYDACGNETEMRYYSMGQLYSERSYEYTTLGAFNLGR